MLKDDPDHKIIIFFFKEITYENVIKRVFVQVNKMKLKKKEEDKAWPLPCASSYFLGHFPIFLYFCFCHFPILVAYSYSIVLPI